MNDTDIDRILEDLFAVLPIFHRKILKMNLGGVTGDLTRLHLGIMGLLSRGNMTASELARLTVVRRPEMTRLIDQLVKAGIVRRETDSKDRRVINIALTDHGRVMLDELNKKVKDNLRLELAGLASEDLAAMSQALDTLRRIAGKL